MKYCCQVDLLALGAVCAETATARKLLVTGGSPRSPEKARSPNYAHPQWQPVDPSSMPPPCDPNEPLDPNMPPCDPNMAAGPRFIGSGAHFIGSGQQFDGPDLMEVGPKSTD
jgi:hypothetical protein